VSPQLLHLVVNHVPVIGAVWTLLVLAIAYLRPEVPAVRVALILTVLLAPAAVAAFLTGEPAEGTIEHLPGVVETAIGPHEDMARVALGGAIAAGLAGLWGFWLLRRRSPRRALLPSLVLVFVTAILMGITAHRGGKIHRPELGGGVRVEAPASAVEP
jgi:uncharacterized membrane protein